MTKLAHQDLIDLMGEDDAAFMQLLKTQLILLMATGQLEMVQLAKEEMVNRGLGLNAEWIGFPAAKKLWLDDAEALTADSLKLFLKLAGEAGNWDGHPLLDISKEEQGNLTDLKQRELLATETDEGHTWVVFTEKGSALAAQHGITLN